MSKSLALLSPVRQGGRRFRRHVRQGWVLVFSAFILTILFCFAAFAIDIGYIVLVRAQLQNAADAACLAAVMELGRTGENADGDLPEESARAEAILVASMNRADGKSVWLNQTVYGVNDDVWIGTRSDDGSSTTWDHEGNDGAYNAVQVTPRRDNPAGSPTTDGQLDLFFADFVFGFFNNGDKYMASVAGRSNAFLAPRDMVFALDRSGSMSFDSDPNDQPNDSTGDAEMRPVYDALFGSSTVTTNSGGDWPGTMLAQSSAGLVTTGSLTDAQAKVPYDHVIAGNHFHQAGGASSLTETQFFDAFFPQSPDGWTGGTVNDHWKHWKWKAYCAWLYRYDNTENLSGSDKVKDDNNWKRRFCYKTFVRWMVQNGYAPAFRNQQFYKRTHFGVSSTLQKLYPLPHASTAALWDDWIFSGDYKSVPIHPIDHVRTATLEGMYVLEENTYEGSEAYDQLGIFGWATLPNDDEVAMGLSTQDDLTSPKQIAANMVSGQRGGNGYTNSEMAILRAKEMLTTDTHDWYRAYSNKLIVFLSDGVPTANGTDGTNGSGNSDPAHVDAAIAEATAARAAGCRIHCIGVGVGQDAEFMQEIADIGGGTYFPVGQDGDVDVDELTAVFVDIAQDRLGKLYKN